MEEETTLPPKMIDPKDISRVDSNILESLKRAKSSEVQKYGIGSGSGPWKFCESVTGSFGWDDSNQWDRFSRMREGEEKGWLEESDQRTKKSEKTKNQQETQPCVAGHLQSTGITPFGQGLFLVPPDQFYYVLYKKNPSCWRETWIESHGVKLQGLELVNTDSLEVKGMLGMEVFKPDQKYAVYFWIQMKKNAKFDTLCRFTLVVADRPDALVLASKVDLKARRPDELQQVKVGEFRATPEKGQVRYSLINFNPDWKSGMILVGVLFQPII